jgi:hypothetical protein
MNLKLNVIIASTLYSNGMYTRSIRYLKRLFEYIIENKIEIESMFTQKAERDVERIKNAVIAMVN